MNDENCVFCKIILGDIPSEIIYETDHIFAFMDINPLSEGHCLIIPKYHASRMDEVPESVLSDVLVAIKKIVIAQGITTYNILQNNGKLAHQEVMHVHFHLIPKMNETSGLQILRKPQGGISQETVAERIRGNIK